MYFAIENSNVRVAGTQHALPADAPTVPEWIRDAYSWVQSLVIEHDTSQALGIFRACGRAASGTRLSQAQIEVLSQSWNPQLGDIRESKPWLVHMVVSMNSVGAVVGVDEWARQRALEEGKSITHLEELADLADAVDRVPEEVFLDEIDLFIRQPELARRRFLALHAAWASRSVERMLAVTRDLPPFRVPELHKAVLGGRNRRWVPKILAHLATSSRTLVLVGALHLCGKGNVAELIEEDGHAIAWL